ncbi:MAG: DNA polymerase III subunit alpha, partial [Nitrospirota bacterium]
DALENSRRIVDDCNLHFTFDELHLPEFKVPPGYDIVSYLRHLCEEGLKWRYPDNWEEMLPRLNYELDVIHDKGYDAYFVIVWDFMNYSRKNKIPIGPGRGSAAGSIVAYSLGITDLDPVQYGLIFERFLNPERKSLPDIDIDFCYNRRQEVINYVKDLYGIERVAQIITFGRMKARAVIRDVGRVFEMPLPVVDKIAKLIPPRAKNIQDALDTEAELEELYSQDMQVKRLLDTAQELEGLARHPGIHAAGVVISKYPLEDCVPLYTTDGTDVCTQYEMKNLEKIGLLKMDFLGLRNLTVMDDTIAMIKKNRMVDVDISVIPLDDKKTVDLLQKAQTVGVFQLESDGMKKIVRELKPEHFEDLIPLVALYRPGPLGSGMVDDFIACRRGRKKIVYKHPLLKSILQETYGVILYQDQVMKISNELGGFTMGQADL